MLHAPKQSRSRKTLERILSAARSLMTAEGVDAIGITQIVSEANSSVGSFYARFDGKEDLLRHLHVLLWQEAGSRWGRGVERWNPRATAEERVEHLVDLIREAVAPDHRLRAALTHAMGDEGKSSLQAFDGRVARDCQALFDRDRDIRHPAPHLGIPTGVRISLSTLRDHLKGTGNGGATPDTIEELGGELSTALRGYWGVGQVVRAQGPAPETEVEYFDIWS